ncbi:DNA polymerase III subunit epsilon [Candidatus Methylopumilus rimovensis]|uniref:DNA polymerase III subunit epsilon n=1 Tax=Candidatus Methylopumilus rimovensis TaxID=2588535 RepID=A0AAE6KPX9_9PROT|nr:DNA polymerase III subunit epsilon [Candidatus Methylopumilus rimovensis]QDD14146.1 DNA polymerase III subunit epsilon [Candidatus Methylopumilus rimovensis]
MRHIFLDTETTGLYANQGHRIIEIAAIEIINRRPTNNSFHFYVNPDREIDPAAQEVHGITLDFLQDKPRFTEIASDFIKFVKDATLIIHNAPFDIGFINMELGLIEKPPIEEAVENVIDTLKMAKDMRPGQRNSLDALCRFYNINNSQRSLHGALLDAQLLAEVYLAMTRGQEDLMIDFQYNGSDIVGEKNAKRPTNLFILKADDEELKSHEAYLNKMKGEKKLAW